MTDHIQGSPEWFAARLGKVTASRVADIVARTKTGVSASRATYRAQLVCERLTGMPQDSFKSPAMEWGTLTEPDARAAYEFETNRKVETVGFVQHPGFIHAGASPDGLVGEDGLIEIKCPNTATHIETLLKRCVPNKYLTQIQWQLAVTGRAWCDYVSFDARLPERMRLYIQRVKRDEATIADLEKNVEIFLGDIEDTLSDLRQYAEAA